MTRTCKEPNCERKHYAREWCITHYARHRKGIPMDLPMKARKGSTWQEKMQFHTGSPDENGCIPWQGPVDTYGYGILKDREKNQLKAHRMAWVLSGRELDDELTIDHLCRNKACLNPDHMEQVTFGENARRMRAAMPEGHRAKVGRFSDEEVREIRERRGELLADLAEEFGVSRSMVSNIQRGKAYTQVH